MDYGPSRGPFVFTVMIALSNKVRDQLLLFFFFNNFVTSAIMSFKVS